MGQSIDSGGKERPPPSPPVVWNFLTLFGAEIPPPCNYPLCTVRVEEEKAACGRGGLVGDSDYVPGL